MDRPIAEDHRARRRTKRYPWHRLLLTALLAFAGGSLAVIVVHEAHADRQLVRWSTFGRFTGSPSDGVELGYLVELSNGSMSGSRFPGSLRLPSRNQGIVGSLLGDTPVVRVNYAHLAVYEWEIVDHRPVPTSLLYAAIVLGVLAGLGLSRVRLLLRWVRPSPRLRRVLVPVLIVLSCAALGALLAVLWRGPHVPELVRGDLLLGAEAAPDGIAVYDSRQVQLIWWAKTEFNLIIGSACGAILGYLLARPLPWLLR